ncbi:MAG TPA: NAD(P)/FAD-dependent oxidoreductase [Rhizomicrobium sp.]|nr:NAD(P)/FAD-dependent oxidoreductase [Rhizomicrobium sp.]
MSAPYDAVVIGAGVNGLAAASYLAMAGKRVVVLDRREAPGGLSETAHALYALDPSVVRELKLARRGLRFAVRDMPLVGLRNDGKHLLLSRDAYASARSVAVHSQNDAKAWTGFRRDWFTLARAMRALWWHAGRKDADLAIHDARVTHFARMGASAWLDSWFESDAVKATLGFDANALSPLAAGSAMLLVWRAAQEMCGLQGAVAFPRGGLGAAIDAFASTARIAGVETHTGSAVSNILLGRDGAVRGVVLLSGDVVEAPLVLSSLSRRRSLSFASVRATLDFGEAAALAHAHAGVQTARVTLELDREPQIVGSAVPARGRFIVAERLESLAHAHAAAQTGRLPQELTLEVILPAAADPTLASPGCHLVSVLITPLPAQIDGGWRGAKALLAAKVVAALSRHMPGLSAHLVGVDVLTPDDVRESYDADDAFGGAVDARRLLADWRSRVRTPVPGLILCGAAVDPVGAVSGRGGRVAACFAFERETQR